MITSNSNTKIKHVEALISNAKLRKQEQAFVVEGQRMVREIPADRILESYVAESFSDFDSIPNVTEYEVVSDAIFKKMSDTMTPQGVLCVVSMSQLQVGDFISSHAKGGLRLLVLESVQDPGNLGTMIRTAEGAGFHGIIADNKTVSVYNPKVTRSTMGAIFRIPIMYTDDIYGVVDDLKSNGIKVVATHLDGKCYYNETKYGDRCAILIGNEGNGLTDEISHKSDVLVKIPMDGQVESLNAAVAAALMMYEVRRGIDDSKLS